MSQLAGNPECNHRDAFENCSLDGSNFSLLIFTNRKSGYSYKYTICHDCGGFLYLGRKLGESENTEKIEESKNELCH